MNVKGFVIALLIALSICLPEAAHAQKQQPDPASFSGIGTVVSVDEAAKKVTIRIDRASRALKHQVGKQVAFRVAGDAFIGCGIGWAGCPMMSPAEMQKKPAEKKKKPASGETVRDQTLSDVEPNDEVRFMGKVSGAGDLQEYTLDQLMVWMF